MMPALPKVDGARYVFDDEASKGYASVGFKLPTAGPRCYVPNEAGKSGAVFLWNGRRQTWEIELGGLEGKALRQWNRAQKALKGGK